MRLRTVRGLAYMLRALTGVKNYRSPLSERVPERRAASADAGTSARS